ncbi:MAG: PSD1 and planctomycete cytochrome C domain-containing protein [Chthoniobacteraceae bacterium]
MLRYAFLLTASLAVAQVPADHAERMTRGAEMFRKDIAPLLKEHCVKCHGGEKTKADFDLATREGLLKGGSEGVAVVPFDSGKSWMMKLVRHEEEPEMPDKKPKLPDDAIAKLAAWIDHGAPYDGPLVEGKAPPRDKSVVSDEDRKWWSFQPLAKVVPPRSGGVPPPTTPALAEPALPSAAEPRTAAGRRRSLDNPIDAFLLAAAAPKGLALNPPADAHTLVRRATLDLTGLPPDESHGTHESYESHVEKLLASPAFGERWARHWLDVARFAESSGFEHDYDRPHAFHYRDFVIKALNSDMPYDQFVRWQLAGDEFAPGDPLALMATGFLGAGVFPTQITANEVERTRYDAMDDMLSTTGSAFLAITVGCARCHDHKFDPIPTADYYRLLSTFTTTVRSNIDVELEPEKTKALRATWAKQGDALKAEVAKVESTLRPAFDQWLASGLGDTASEWTLLEPTDLKSSGKATFKPLGDGSYLVEGESAVWDTYTITAPVAQQRITALRLEALTHPSLKRKGPGRAGNGNFGLGKITVTLGTNAATIARAFADFEQNKTNLSIAGSLDMDSSSGWAVDGQIGKDHAAVFVFDPPLDPPAGAKLTINLSHTVNTQHGIGRPRLAITGADDPKLEGSALSAKIATAMQHARTGAKLADADRTTLFAWWKQREKTWQAANKQLTDHNAKEPDGTTTVLVCAEGHKPLVMHSQGAPFLDETHILKRGDTNQKESVAAQSFLQVLMRGDANQWQWSPPKDAKYTGRRRSLANWLTDVDHGPGALLARVAVNRVWQHHFGRGLVSTPNDFGKTGALPSHPELLDWLAGEFIRNGWRMKPIHRLIMTSAAYQQSSAADAAKVALDPDNALFLRRTPVRLEAEAVRDSILAVSGLLDRTMFGPGTLDENSKRRSIYFTIKRSRLLNSMVVFDAPEPLVSQGSRPTTTVAPQALLLMNSPQVRAWAEALAQRAGNPERAYQLALGRAPSADEAAAAAKFIATGGTSALADLCQVLFGLNEFAYLP